MAPVRGRKPKGSAPVPPTVYRKVRKAAMDYGFTTTGGSSVANQSRFDILLRGWLNSHCLVGGIGYNHNLAVKAAAAADGRSITILQYVIYTQMYTSGAEYSTQTGIVNGGPDGTGANPYWAFVANTTTKTRAQTGYAAYEVNITRAPAPNAAGDRAAAAIVKANYDLRLKPLFLNGAVDGPFFDNFWGHAWQDADNNLGTDIAGDYNLDGTNDNTLDPAHGVAFRLGNQDAVTKARSLMPGCVVAANTDFDKYSYKSSLSWSELTNQVDIAMCEAFVGREYSVDKFNMFDTGSEGIYYVLKQHMANVKAGGTCLVLAYPDPYNFNDFLQKSRYTIAVSHLQNATPIIKADPGFYYPAGSTTFDTIPWLNEFDAMIGEPVDPPQSGPRTTGIWAGTGLYAREYENGWVIANPSDNKTRPMNGAYATHTLTRSNSTGRVRLTWSRWSTVPHGAAIGDKTQVRECWFCTVPVRTGTGNGTCSTPTFASAAGFGGKVAQSETWTLTATSSTTFTVVGAVSGTKANATVGVSYNNSIVAFKITAGATPFVAGDKFTFDAIVDVDGTYTIADVQSTYIEWQGPTGRKAFTVTNPKGYHRLQAEVDLTTLGVKAILGTDDAHNDYDGGTTSQNDGRVLGVTRLWNTDGLVVLKV
jgi:hypothetical protein